MASKDGADGPKPEGSGSGAADNAASTSEPGEEVEDLSKLLDSALGDFGKAVPPSGGAEGGGLEMPPGSPFVNQEMAQQAAKEFQNMLKQLAEVQKAVLQQAGPPDPAAPAPANPPEGISFPPNMMMGDAAGGMPPFPFPAGEGGFAPDEAQFAEAMLQNLSQLADKVQKVSDAKGEGEFAEAMQSLHENENYENEFLPFMQGLMGSLLSKDMMYPSLKEMSEKYPAWIEEHKDTVGAADLERYQKQVVLMKEACDTYETEKDDDTDEIIGARFEKLIGIMQRMQMCGAPPEDLVGALPPGWDLDASTGMPRVTDNMQAADSCSLM